MIGKGKMHLGLKPANANLQLSSSMVKIKWNFLDLTMGSLHPSKKRDAQKTLLHAENFHPDSNKKNIGLEPYFINSLLSEINTLVPDTKF